jgi:hypothetical protein
VAGATLTFFLRKIVEEESMLWGIFSVEREEMKVTAMGGRGTKATRGVHLGGNQNISFDRFVLERAHLIIQL